MANGFRLRGQRHLITWSQVTTETHLDVFELLESYAPVKATVIAREKHEDGNPHFHAFVLWERCLDRTLSTQLDLFGKHPNIKAKRTQNEIANAISYCQKDDDWIIYNEDALCETSTAETLTERAELSPSYRSWIDECFADRTPFMYAREAYNITKKCDTQQFLDGDVHEGIVESADLRDFRWNEVDHTKTLVISGPTGTGKTTWAINNMPRPSIVVTNLNDLADFRPLFHRSIIFDDINLWDRRARQYVDFNKQLALCEWHYQRSVRILYGVVKIPKHIHKCFTCNPERFPLDRSEPAIARRLEVFEF